MTNNQWSPWLFYENILECQLNWHPNGLFLPWCVWCTACYFWQKIHCITYKYTLCLLNCWWVKGSLPFTHQAYQSFSRELLLKINWSKRPYGNSFYAEKILHLRRQEIIIWSWPIMVFSYLTKSALISTLAASQ